jgi:putative addiction module killer protein
MGWRVCDSVQPTPKEIIVYSDSTGVEPFTEWIREIKDKRARAAILRRVSRFREGLFGEWKFVGDGVFESKFKDGAGFRIYFAQTATQVFILGGGQKSRQQRDIDAAKALWRGHG